MKREKTARKERIWELDFLRGFSIILVVFDHMFYDYGQFFRPWATCGVSFLEWLNRISNVYLDGDLRFFWRPAFLFVFFSVSGICTAFSKNNFVRGIKLWLVAIAVSAISYLGKVVADTPFILFGVLHCLAVIILLYAAVEGILRGSFFLVEKIAKKPLKDRIKTIVCASVYLIIFIVTLWINTKYNPKLYDVEANYTVTTLDGKKWGMFFFAKEWWTSDYFPLFPFISFFFLGAFLSKTLYCKKKTLFPLLDGVWNKGMTFAGKYSLWIYLAGQVFFIGLGALLSIFLLGDSLLFS